MAFHPFFQLFSIFSLQQRLNWIRPSKNGYYAFFYSREWGREGGKTRTTQKGELIFLALWRQLTPRAFRDVMNFHEPFHEPHPRPTPLMQSSCYECELDAFFFRLNFSNLNKFFGSRLRLNGGECSQIGSPGGRSLQIFKLNLEEFQVVSFYVNFMTESLKLDFLGEKRDLDVTPETFFRIMKPAALSRCTFTNQICFGIDGNAEKLFVTSLEGWCVLWNIKCVSQTRKPDFIMIIQ